MHIVFLIHARCACSQWPTFPQIFIKGEFIGGSDIILNLHQVNNKLVMYFGCYLLFFSFEMEMRSSDTFGESDADWRTEGKAKGYCGQSRKL